MKKLFVISLLAVLAFSCEEEGLKRVSGARSNFDCYLSSMTASNMETVSWIVEDGKIVGTKYGDVVSETEYIYDDEGKLVEQIAGTTVWEYTYNNNDKLIKAEVISAGTTVSETTYTYANSGTLKKSIGEFYSDHGTSTTETLYEYKNGNPVKLTTQLSSTDNPDGFPTLITLIEYDSKNSPYSTLNLNSPMTQRNNPIKYTYVDRPEQDQEVNYTYNQEGYPITYEQIEINRPDYPIVTGEYIYSCE